MVLVAQLVRASDCGSEGRGFEPHLAPQKKKARVNNSRLFLLEGSLSNEILHFSPVLR